ncbi:MAG: T9SS type A sorting domain-containing protein [Flavobacteriales bacterium]
MLPRSLRAPFLAITSALFASTGAYSQGDLCTTAVPVTPGTYTADGPSTGGGAIGACLGPNFNADWYTYTASGNGTWTVGSCLDGTDTRLQVYSGDCTTLLCIGSSDDQCGLSSEVAGLTAVAGQTYYIEWDDFWTTSGFEWYLNFFCANAPQSTYNVVLDCPNGSFSIEVTVTGLGTASDVDITNTGGAPTVSGVGLGTYTIGPFPLNTTVSYSVVNNTDPGCDYFSPGITNLPCPIISCGPDNYTYCYGNGETTYFVYQGANTFPIALLFNAGGIYQFGGDFITVYDGLSTNDPVIYSGYDDGDLAGMFFVSTNPDHALTLQITSDGFISCADFNVFPQWDYTVACLDCTPPAATYNVVMDCANMQFFIDVDLSTLGTDPDIDILNNAGAPPVLATAPGVYTTGPYPDGTSVMITLVNDANPLCVVTSPVFANIICPELVTCGGQPLTDTYCYINFDSHIWHWQSSDGVSPLAMIWSQGFIESVFYDSLTIFDGPDANSPILYDHIDFNAEDLTGLLVVSTGPDIFMQMSSDGSVSCGDGSFVSWAWEIGCLDCMVPGATFTVVPDCPHRQYTVEVNVTSTGDATDVDIVNNLNTDTIQNVGLGTYSVGPFGNDTAVVVTILNGLNSLCRQNSLPLVSMDTSCVYHTCDQQGTYCYTNNDEAWFVYQAASPGPITVEFLQGEMLVGDKVVIYNGFDDLSALLFNGNNGGDMTGLAVNSLNPDNALALRVLGDAAGSCVGGQVDDDLIWTINCGAVNVDEEPTAEDFVLYPNPTQGTLNIGLNHHWAGNVQVTIMDLSGRVVRNEGMLVAGGAANSIDLTNLSNGNYAVQLTTERWTRTKQIEVHR